MNRNLAFGLHSPGQVPIVKFADLMIRRHLCPAVDYKSKWLNERLVNCIPGRILKTHVNDWTGGNKARQYFRVMECLI